MEEQQTKSAIRRLPPPSFDQPGDGAQSHLWLSELGSRKFGCPLVTMYEWQTVARSDVEKLRSKWREDDGDHVVFPPKTPDSP